MSNFSDFISSGGGGGLPVNIVLGHSQTWVPPVDGNICIYVVGAGGGSRGSRYTLLSAGAGGYCKKNSLAVTTSGSFTVVVGAGGEGKYNVNGTTGGTTSVAGTGLSAALRAFGGTGSTATAHGSGGSADGGDVNNTGGAGNFSGGGAVGITGTGNAGGANPGRNSPYGGGHCDVVGPESLMGHGYICGGLGGDMFTTRSNSNSIAPVNYSPAGNGGFLAGGGSAQIVSSGLNSYMHGGHGGIGGGGGGCANAYSDNISTGGDGGNGLVIIQYLPA